MEIFPGHWIEVTSKMKKKAGIRKSQRVVATLMGETVAAAGRMVRDGQKTAKYPMLMLDEAARIAHKEGMKVAVKETGINKHSIDLRVRQLRHAGKLARKNKGHNGPLAIGRRYTMAQKQACVRLAKELMASNEKVERYERCYNRTYLRKRYKWSHGSAFREAGRRLGMNGKSIEWMFLQGSIPLTQQPSGL